MRSCIKYGGTCCVLSVDVAVYVVITCIVGINLNSCYVYVVPFNRPSVGIGINARWTVKAKASPATSRSSVREYPDEGPTEVYRTELYLVRVVI